MADPASPAASQDPAVPATPVAPPWHQGLDNGLLGHAQNKGWKLDDPKEAFLSAAKAHMEAQKHFGHPPEQLLRVPSKPDDEEGWKAIWQRVGVPNEAKDYDFAGVKFADGTDLEAAFTDTMRAALLAARVAKDHAPTVVKAMIKYLDDADAAEAADAKTKLDVEKATLVKNWGTNYEFNRLKAMEGARRLGIDPEAVALLESQVGYSKVMEAMRRVGVGTSEDTFKDGGPAPNNILTRDGAMARRRELMNDKAWVARYDRGDTEARREMLNLSQIISGQTMADIRAA